MTNALRIAEVADRAGMTTATIRYYERVGVLPPPARAHNGYRVYGEDTVLRLAFVSRAKQLGCSLDEIADLAVAWEGGECGPIQDRLRALVADKLAASEAEIVELVTLSGELRRAAAALERHRPQGACDDRCGCIGDPTPTDPTSTDPTPTDTTRTDPTPTVAAAPTTVSAGDDVGPIACTLGPELTRDRIDDWHRLLDGRPGRDDGVTSRLAIAGGVRLELGDDADVAEIVRLATAEQDCCRFFSFAVTIDGRGTGLEVTSPDDGLAAVHALFGVPA